MLAGEERPGAVHARLHFVQNQQRVAGLDGLALLTAHDQDPGRDLGRDLDLVGLNRAR